MLLHDFKCTHCGVIEKDIIVTRGEKVRCVKCFEFMEVYYGFWSDLALTNHGDLNSSRLDKDGYIRKFGVLDDKYAAAQLGLAEQGRGLKKFSDEEAAEWRTRLAVEGDSDKLRKDVLGRIDQIEAERTSQRKHS